MAKPRPSPANIRIGTIIGDGLGPFSAIGSRLGLSGRKDPLEDDFESEESDFEAEGVVTYDEEGFVSPLGAVPFGVTRPGLDLSCRTTGISLLALEACPSAFSS